jgi:hypothetical protein
VTSGDVGVSACDVVKNFLREISWCCREGVVSAVTSRDGMISRVRQGRG